MKRVVRWIGIVIVVLLLAVAAACSRLTRTGFAPCWKRSLPGAGARR